MLTSRPDSYLIATAAEVPRDFRVKLLPNSENPINKGVFHVKGTGEPAYNLGAAAFIALQRAVNAARGEAGSGWVSLPATHEAVRLAIGPISFANVTSTVVAPINLDLK